MNISEDAHESITYYTKEISTLLSTINNEKTYQTLFEIFFKLCQMCTVMEIQTKTQQTKLNKDSVKMKLYAVPIKR